MAASTHFESPQGEFSLQRYPRRRQELLQAWCSADSLLLDAADAHLNTLAVNDEQGALSVAMEPTAHWTDSAMSALAIGENCAINNRRPPETVWSAAYPAHPCEQVLVRIPKQLPYFEYQLALLAGNLAPGTTVYLAGMDKHLSPHTATIIERHFDQVERHRGRRKARLFTARQGDKKRPFDGNVYSHYDCAQLNAELRALPNVFSRDQLDRGSRLLIDNLEKVPPAKNVADLACGNGVLGIAAALVHSAEAVTFCDESAMAVASASLNRDAILPGSIPVSFHHGDGLLGLNQHFDRILCNPPFHLAHTVDDFAGQRLLQQCVGALCPGGDLVLVANAHLPYKRTLQKSFAAVHQIARNEKFIVWRAESGC